MGVLSAPNLTSIAYVGSLPSSPFATTVLNGSTQEALRVEATSNTAATTRTIGLVVLSNSAAQSYSTELIGIRVQSGAIGASSTVATQIGLAFQGVSGATNNAFISDNEGFSGNYFINSTSTNPSVFSGPMTIGSLNTQQHVLNTKLGTTASGAGTLLNLPSGKSGNPTGFVQMTINGSTAYIPYW